MSFPIECTFIHSHLFSSECSFPRELPNTEQCTVHSAFPHYIIVSVNFCMSKLRISCPSVQTLSICKFTIVLGYLSQLDNINVKSSVTETRRLIATCLVFSWMCKVYTPVKFTPSRTKKEPVLPGGETILPVLCTLCTWKIAGMPFLDSAML